MLLMEMLFIIIILDIRNIISPIHYFIIISNRIVVAIVIIILSIIIIILLVVVVNIPANCHVEPKICGDFHHFGIPKYQWRRQQGRHP